MLLSLLPKPEQTGEPTLPGVYNDHFLFYEKLQQPYYYPEHSSALGLLSSGKGTCDYIVNGVRNRVLNNQLFLVNRHSRLAIRAEKKETAPALLFFDSRLPELVKHSIDSTDEKLLEEKDALYDFSYLERIHDNASLSQALHTLVLLGSSCSSFASLKADIMIRNLFEKFLRQNSDALHLSKNIPALKAATRREIYKRLSMAKEWMEANYSSRLTLDDMAVVANMNSQHFLRMFKEVYGTTPHQCLTGIKLEKAKEFLRAGAMTVIEICSAIGFESVYSFTTLFRKRFGMPPGAYASRAKILHFR